MKYFYKTIYETEYNEITLKELTELAEENDPNHCNALALVKVENNCMYFQVHEYTC